MLFAQGCEDVGECCRVEVGGDDVFGVGIGVVVDVLEYCWGEDVAGHDTLLLIRIRTMELRPSLQSEVAATCVSTRKFLRHDMAVYTCTWKRIFGSSSWHAVKDCEQVLNDHPNRK